MVQGWGEGRLVPKILNSSQGSNLNFGIIDYLKLSTAPSSTKLDRGRLMFLSAEPSPSELEAGLRLGEEYVLLSRRPPSPILYS